jgi:anti-sigma factor RsiW
MSRFECVDFKVSLSPYLDGELDRDTRTRADRHLLECRACRDLLERAERQDAAVRVAFTGDDLETAPLPAGFERSVFAAIEGKPAAASVGRSRRRRRSPSR